MSRSPVRALALVLVTCAALLSSHAPVWARSDDTLVGPFRLHTTISAGLANAFSASNVRIDPGTYHECPSVTGLVLLTIVGKKGVVIDATGCNDGLTISDGEGIIVKGVTIVGARRGLVVKGAASRVLVTKTTIQDPAADPQLAVMETGVEIQGAADVTLDGVTIRGASVQAVHVLLAARTIVRKSTLAASVGDGVVVDFGTSAAIEKNVMTSLGGWAVQFANIGFGGAADALVASNKVFANPAGLDIDGTGNVIEKNKLTDIATVGIRAAGANGGSTYRKNTIVRAADAAIVAAGTGDTFEKNTVKEPLQEGIDVSGDNNVFVGGKVVEAVGNGVLVQATASGNRFEGTASSKAGADGFHVDGTANTFLKAKASGSGGLDVNDPAAGATTNVYTDCKFKTSNLP
jgi:hypothetical protein